MVREPAVQGIFYPATSPEIIEFIQHEYLTTDIKLKNPTGAIVPHAGWMYSGKLANTIFKLLAGFNYDLFVFIGPKHTYFGYGGLSSEDWKTPLGEVITDKSSLNMLRGLGLPVDDDSHQAEHSIEVLLPFFRYYFKGIPMLAITVPDQNIMATAVRAINELKKHKKICVIASSDFTHYGPKFGYQPFTSNIKENLYKLDKEAINLILKKDPASFAGFIEETGATICGFLPILALLQTAEGRGRLVSYYTSGDITGDYTDVVGYAGIIFDTRDS